MSSRRKPYALKGGKRLLPQSVISDFPIPNCGECGSQMVKLEGQWGCKVCSKIQVLRPTGEVGFIKGRLVPRLKMQILPLGEAYPNRASRRAVRS